MTSEAESGIKLYIKNAISSVATLGIQLTVLVWVNQHLVRRITPEEYSLFPVVMSLMFAAELFRKIFTGGLTRYIIEADAQEGAGGVTRIVSSMMPGLVLAASVALLVGGFCIWQMDRLVEIKPEFLDDARIMLGLLIGNLAINILTGPFSQGLYIRQKFTTANLIDLSTEAVRVTILLVLLFGVSTRVIWLVVASTVATLINLGWRIVLTRRILPGTRFERKLVSFATARTLLSFGAWTSIQGITDLVSKTVPVLFLNKFSTAVDVSAFHLGRLPDIQFRRIIAAAAMPAQAAMTRVFAISGGEAMKELYYRGGRYHMWIALVLIAPLTAFAREVVTLYVGETYIATAGVIVCYLAVYPLIWASAMFYRVAHAIARVRAYYICDIFGQVLTLGALYYAVVVRREGAVGAAAAIAISQGLFHLFVIWPAGYRLVNGNAKVFILTTLIPGAIPFASSLAICFLFSRFVEMNSWLAIGGATAFSVACYLLVLARFCLDPFERDLLRKGLARVQGVLAQILSTPQRVASKSNG
jgi:O-antigen/teichoic acid export membrane protein